MIERHQAHLLRQRLNAAPVFMTIVAGPRQVGKSTMVRQVLGERRAHYVATDQPTNPSGLGETFATTRLQPGATADKDWLVEQWTFARTQARVHKQVHAFVLAIDEVQKVSGWSEVVKGLWDADRAEGLALHVVLLGSSPWLMRRGFTESLAGRYELLRMTHWSYPEMQEAFDFSLEEFVYFGGYPGCATLIRDERRWREYVRAALIAPCIERDILQMTRVDKPALLKSLFELGCTYSGQIIAYTKLLGQLQDAGNTVTLAHYLELLAQAGLLIGMPKFAGQKHRQRASPPKLNALNTALISALSGYGFVEAQNDRSHWGRLVESAVGAHLCNTATDNCEVHYWRESPHEVDFILRSGRKLLAIEVKSGKQLKVHQGLVAFGGQYVEARSMVVGDGGVSLAAFLARPAGDWLEQ